MIQSSYSCPSHQGKFPCYKFQHSICSSCSWGMSGLPGTKLVTNFLDSRISCGKKHCSHHFLKMSCCSNSAFQQVDTFDMVIRLPYTQSQRCKLETAIYKSLNLRDFKQMVKPQNTWPPDTAMNYQIFIPHGCQCCETNSKTSQSSMIELSEVIYSPAKPKSEESKNVKIGLIKPL